MQPVKTVKGVFLDLNASDIITASPQGVEFKFSSYKKQEMYIKKVYKELAAIEVLRSKVGGKDSYYAELIEEAYIKVYDGMIQK